MQSKFVTAYIYSIRLKNAATKEATEIIILKKRLLSSSGTTVLDFYDKDSTLGMIIGDR
jgi:hypothetical protein